MKAAKAFLNKAFERDENYALTNPGRFAIVMFGIFVATALITVGTI